MKTDGAPDVDVAKAVAELKARKRTLEAKVSRQPKQNTLMTQCLIHHHDMNNGLRELSVSL